MSECVHVHTCIHVRCLYACISVCLCANICTHAHTNTYTREIGREQEGARSIVRARSSLERQEGQRGDGEIRGEQRQTGMMGC